MYDLSSYSPAYPHARYGHTTALLTDNHLLLYGGCFKVKNITHLFDSFPNKYCILSMIHPLSHTYI